MKKYVLQIRQKDYKYENMYRYFYRLFNSYYELQKHLQKFWYIEKNMYTIFEETDLTKDYSVNDIKRSRR